MRNGTKLRSRSQVKETADRAARRIEKRREKDPEFLIPPRKKRK